MKKRTAVIAAALTLAGMSMSAQTAAPAPTQAQIDSLSEAVAAYMAPSIASLIADLGTLDAQVDTEKFLSAFAAIIRGAEPAFNVSEANSYIDEFVKARRPYIPETLSDESQQQFLAEAAAVKGAQTLPSGLVFITLEPGSGPMPADTTDVTVNYIGSFANGFVFDRTTEPVEMNVGSLVAGFSEGLKLMQPGGRYRIVMPASLAYGSRGIPGRIPGNAALDFTVELIDCSPKPAE